jgi:hypothetical protein
VDFQSHSKFLAFFLQDSPDAFERCKALAADLQSPATAINDIASIQFSRAGETAATDVKDVTFTGRVYIYHETRFSVQQLADLEAVFRSKNAAVQFRGHEYRLLHGRRPMLAKAPEIEFRPLPATWQATPDAATINAVRRTILDWDGDNRQVIYQWLRNHNRSHDEVMAMDWFAVRMAFGTAIPLGTAAITNEPTVVRYDPPKPEITRKKPGRTFQVSKGQFGKWPEGSTFTEYEFRAATGYPPAPHPVIDPKTHLNEYFDEILDGHLKRGVIRALA